MKRRDLLTGVATMPLANVVLAIPAGASTANGTDTAWRALFAANAAYGNAALALDDAEDAIWTEPPPEPTVELPPNTGGKPHRLTLAELRHARDTDRLLQPPDDGTFEAIAREMLDRELKLRQMRTPEASAKRRALYDSLEAELVKQGADTKPQKPPHIVRLDAELEAAAKRVDDAEDALFDAPVLTIEDAIRKLQHALERHMDPEDYDAMMVAQALDGLRRIAATA